MAKKRSPDFLGIGVMKGGSTWTWEQLRKHPDVGTPRNLRGKRIKEFHFFDRLIMSLRDYKKVFGKLRHQSVGEFTPNYFSCPNTPGIIKNFFPDVKLFVLLRNPTDRAFSHYKDHLWLGKVKKKTPFWRAFVGGHSKFDLPHFSIQAKGMYGDLLEYWYRYFDPSQLKVFFYDDMIAEPLKFLKKLYRWVGVDHSFVPPNYDEQIIKPYNRAFDSLKMEEKDRQRVVEFYAPQVEKLSMLTGRKLNWG